MKYNEALHLVLAAAEVRAEQWRAVANGVSPADVVDELHEAAGDVDLGVSDEPNQQATLLEEALELVRNKSPYWERIEYLSDQLASDVVDLQDEAESDPDYLAIPDGERRPVLPEDTPDHLDEARGWLGEALDVIDRAAYPGYKAGK